MAELSFKVDNASIATHIDDKLITTEVQVFADLCLDAIQLYAKKNHDYGDSFNKGMDAIGSAYSVGRLFDKVNRLITLSKKEDEAQVNESYDDTLMDLACYSIMTIAYRKLHSNKTTKNIIKFTE